MLCPACGHDNKPEHIFCASCLEMLTKKRPQAIGGGRVVSMPPQNEHLVDISYQSMTPPASNSSKWGWVVWGVLGVGLMMVVYYVLQG